jgi:hypothetical protein
VGAYSAPPGNQGPSWSNVVTAQTAAGAGSASCSVTSFTVKKATGAAGVTSVARVSKSSRLLVDDFTVNVITSGPCTLIAARYVPDDVATRQNLTSADNINWVGTLNGKATEWALGKHLVAIWDEATTTNLNSSASVTVIPAP